MRSALWLRCAAAVAPSRGKSSESGAGGEAEMSFRRLPIYTWQLHAIQLSRRGGSNSGSSGYDGGVGDRTAATRQRSKAADKVSCLPPSAVLYHGAHIGPRPLIILDHSLPPAAISGAAGEAAGGPAVNATATLVTSVPVSPAAMRAARKYVAMLSHLRWPHGAVYIPVHVLTPAAGEVAREESLMDASCQQVLAVLDALGIPWAHFLTYGYGTLVAARLAASRGASSRVGTLISLDTPLVTAAMVRNHAAREELAAARQSVNVPTPEVAFAEEALREGLEGPLPCPVAELAAAAGVAEGSIVDPALAESDMALYRDYLFDPAAIFVEGGLMRRELRYTPLHALAEVQHPFQILLPVKGAVCDALIHREFLGVRRPAVIKRAASHAALFGIDTGASGASEGEQMIGRGAKGDKGERVETSGGTRSTLDAVREVAEVVGAWLDRFEQDTILARRYAQASRETTALMGGSATGAAAVTGGRGGGDGAGIAGGDGKKKAKKEKREKRKV